MNKVLKVIRNIIYTILTTIGVLWLIVLLSGLVGGFYLVTKVIPMVESARVDSFNSLTNIQSTTFKHLSDTEVYDANLDVISELNVGNYEYVEYKNLSKYIIEGYIAVEDKNYKKHNGVDYKALLRAATVLVKNKGEITQGGSTITQQVVKNTLLDNKKTLERKLIEFFLAQDLEKEYNKGEIFEFYVNTIFYGNNCNGVETASKYYFGKSSKDLEIEEAALLIGMSNNATMYNPLSKPKETKEKRDRVLNTMYKENVITHEQYEKAKATDFDFALQREARVEEDYLTSYAVYNATIELMKIENFNFVYYFDTKESYDGYIESYHKKYSEISENIRQGGYKIYTTLDKSKQEILQDEIDKQLSYSSEMQDNGKFALQGASVLINNETGYVEAIVGGRGIEDNFNRGFLAIRQPGSAIKPIIAYGPAYDTLKYYPSYKMEDKYSEDGPKNYNSKYIGKVSLRQALAGSINTIAFQLLGEIGPNTGLKYLSEMEFGNISYIDKNNGALALGGFTTGVKVVDLAKAYHTIYSDGVYSDKGCITRIESETGGVIYNKDHKYKEVYKPESAYMVLDSLIAGVEQSYGLSRSRTIKGVQSGSKSGTTNSQKDVWFSGISPYYTLTVWVGYDTPKPTGTYGSGVPGGIWQSTMNRLHEGISNPKKFIKPQTIIELPINWDGNIVEYSSGNKDIFSIEMLQIEDKISADERKSRQSDLDEIVRARVELSLQEILNYVVYDYESAIYIQSKYLEIIQDINTIENDSVLKIELTNQLDAIYSSYEEVIRDIMIIQDTPIDLEPISEPIIDILPLPNPELEVLPDDNLEVVVESNTELEMSPLSLLLSVDKDLNFIETNKDKKDQYATIESILPSLTEKIEKIENTITKKNRKDKLDKLIKHVKSKVKIVEEVDEEKADD